MVLHSDNSDATRETLIETSSPPILAPLRRSLTRIPPRWRRAILGLFGIVVALLALAFSARGVDRAGLADAFRGVNWWWVAAAGVANVVNIVTQGWAWRIGLEAGGAGPVATRHAVAATWVGKAGNQLLPGKVGEVARIALIRSHLGPDHREVTRIVGSLVAQRALSFVAMVMIVTVVALMMPLPVAIPGGRFAPLAVLLVITAAGVALVATRRMNLPQMNGSGRLRSMARAFAGGASLLRPTRSTAVVLGFHFVAVAAQLTTFACLLRGFDVNAPATAPLLIIALVALVGAVPSTPGGVGLQQAALVAPLGAAYNVDPSSALAFALGLQVTIAAVAVAGGLVALLHHRRSGTVRTAFP